MLVIRGHLESSQQGFSEIEAHLNRQGPLKYRAWDSAFVASSQRTALRLVQGPRLGKDGL